MSGRISEQEYKDARLKHDESEKIMLEYHKEKVEEADNRWDRAKHGESFKDDELIYAATARCKKCGAGMACLKNVGSVRQWTCSNVLKDIGTDTGHDAFNFAFYEIKSELQPSANGETTRPINQPQTKG